MVLVAELVNPAILLKNRDQLKNGRKISTKKWRDILHGSWMPQNCIR